MRRYRRFAAGITMLVLGSCSLIHHKQPQAPQEFVEAIQRGDSVRATSIWLHMTPAERQNLVHGIGLKRQILPSDVQAQLFKHQTAAAKIEDEQSADWSDTNSTDAGDSDAETIEIPAAAIDPKASLQNLTNLAK